MKQKKGQGLPVNVIIIAVVGLVVLFVLIAIFVKFSGSAQDNLGDCKNKGGVCRDSCVPDKEVKVFLPGGCKETNNICCVKVRETSGSGGGGDGEDQ
jgi:hypothetical protein